MNPRRCSGPALLVCLVFLPSGLAGATPLETSPAAAPALAERHVQWLEEVDVILSREERDAFLALGRDYQRDAFIERFWREREVDPHTGRNEFRDHWREKVETARAEFGGVREVRSRYYLLHGPPEPRVLVYCQRREPQIEIWMYPAGSEVERRPFPLFFVRPYGAVRYMQLWEPGDAALTDSCEPDTLTIDEQFALRNAFKLLEDRDGIEYLALLARVRDRPPSPDREWVATFQAQSTDVPTGAAALGASFDVRTAGARQSRAMIEGTVTVEPAAATTSISPSPATAVRDTRHFLLNGEVVLDGVLFESFRVQYAPPAQSGPLPLSFVRALRPGTYTLIVRVEEPARSAFFRIEQELVVAAVPSASPGAGEGGAEAEAPALELLAPKGAVRGRVRFDARVTGVAVATVEFRLDGKRVLVKRAAPWSVELDLGAAARPRRIEAVAFDGAGNELLRDERLVNAGEYRFALRLLEPRANAAAGAHVRARAEVAIPQGAELARVDFLLDDRALASLLDPPWELPLTLPADSALHVLRAVALLADGSSTEDSVLLNQPGASARIDVRMVELLARVTGRGGRAVHGLGCGDFRLREDGVEQTLVRCEEAEERTLHLGVLLDTSASMAERLKEAAIAADGFLGKLLRPRDRATLVAFNDFPNRLAPFTNDLAALRSALDGLKAERGTALWDAVIATLQDFGGVEGRRAVLLLSDGEDRASSATFAEASALARQSGVVLYAVGIDLPFGSARRDLRRLSEETGGEAFFVHDAQELAGVYERIADALRSQYLLAYQSTSNGEGFRVLTVEARRRGVEIAAPAGYQP